MGGARDRSGRVTWRRRCEKANWEKKDIPGRGNSTNKDEGDRWQGA